MDNLRLFEKLVVDLLGNDNNSRVTAERTYDEVPLRDKASMLLQLYMDSNVNNEVSSLSHLLFRVFSTFLCVGASHTPFQVRSMALVLFRRLLSADYKELWQAVGEEAKPEFFQRFIQFLTEEKVPILRKRLTDIVAEVARNTISE